MSFRQMPAFILLIMIFGYVVASVKGQTESFSVEGFTPALLHEEWESNSSGFVFQNPTTALWYMVDVTTQEVASFGNNPLLTVDDMGNVGAINNFRVSPDRSFFLAITEGVSLENVTEGESQQFFYTLMSTDTQEQVASELRAPDVDGFGGLVQALWSADSRSVAIGSVSEAGTRHIHFLHIPDPADLQSIIEISFEETIQGHRFYTADPLANRLFDISESGRFVLLGAQEDDPNLDWSREQRYLILWSPLDPSASQLLDISTLEPALMTAAFASQREDQFYIWEFESFGSTSGNLYRFDLITHQLNLLTSIDGLYNPSFSPDGEWFSYSTDDSLVFLRLEELQNSPEAKAIRLEETR